MGAAGVQVTVMVPQGFLLQQIRPLCLPAQHPGLDPPPAPAPNPGPTNSRRHCALPQTPPTRAPPTLTCATCDSHHRCSSPPGVSLGCRQPPPTLFESQGRHQSKPQTHPYQGRPPTPFAFPHNPHSLAPLVAVVVCVEVHQACHLAAVSSLHPPTKPKPTSAHHS
jgi:hypothetical protein